MAAIFFCACILLSLTIFHRRSLETRAPWIHLVSMPNLYRGQYQVESYGGQQAEGGGGEEVLQRQTEEVAAASEKYVGEKQQKIVLNRN
jgi:hypothetical protein